MYSNIYIQRYCIIWSYSNRALAAGQPHFYSPLQIKLSTFATTRSTTLARSPPSLPFFSVHHVTSCLTIDIDRATRESHLLILGKWFVIFPPLPRTRCIFIYLFIYRTSGILIFVGSSGRHHADSGRKGSYCAPRCALAVGYSNIDLTIHACRLCSDSSLRGRWSDNTAVRLCRVTYISRFTQ
jgi:hypothetical protein